MIGLVEKLDLPVQGAIRQADGQTLWRVWAPQKSKVDLVLWNQDGVKSAQAMDRLSGSYFEWKGPAESGQLYAYKIGGRELPDPASRWQPQGVHRPSAVFHPDEFAWTDSQWRGLSPDVLAIYELHVGTFTPEGTFAGVETRLGQLQDLGITALELMPTAQFPGV